QPQVFRDSFHGCPLLDAPGAGGRVPKRPRMIRLTIHARHISVHAWTRGHAAPSVRPLSRESSPPEVDLALHAFEQPGPASAAPAEPLLWANRVAGEWLLASCGAGGRGSAGVLPHAC